MSTGLLETDGLIVALASAPGQAERGIIRLSGDRLLPFLADWQGASIATTGGAQLHSSLLPIAGWRQPVEVLLALWPGARSYTGQPVAELHAPGSPPLLEALVAEAVRRGARLARPGEFTLRAYLSGRLDLAQAEAVLGVIDAVDHRELEVALQQLGGGVSRQFQALQQQLMNLLADLEAGLDFVDEDLEFVTRAEIAARVTETLHEVRRALTAAGSRLPARVHPRVVLAGLPNAGKSTLFNCLANRSAAIVSPVAGTTRDYLQQTIEGEGVAFELIDTPGWESTGHENSVAAIAQSLGTEQVRRAQLVVWCTAADLSADAARIDAAVAAEVRRERTMGSWLSIVTRADRRPAGDRSWPHVSVVTGQGLAELRAKISAACRDAAGQAGADWLGMTVARCETSLADAAGALERVLHGIEQGLGDELLSIDLRIALDELGAVTGVVATDDLLGRIFSRFCIGK